jgi:uncharacterized membrane protein (Fun14 family)
MVDSPFFYAAGPKQALAIQPIRPLPLSQLVRVYPTFPCQKMNSLKGKLTALLLLFVVTLCCPTTANAAVTIDNDPTEIVAKWVSNAREQYDRLPDQGKFATGAVVGFTTSKMAVKSAVKFVKIAGAAFIATEVLEAAGILDVDSYVDTEATENLKQKAISKIGDIRKSIHKRFDGNNLKRWMEKDKMGTMGAAAGAFFGFLL